MATHATPAPRAPASAEREAPCRSVLMVGTSFQTKGGISSVVRGYADGGLFERVNCRYVITHRDGSAPTRVFTALSGWCRAFVGLFRDAPLVHIHLSQRGSFWRKSAVCFMARLMGRPYIVHLHGSEFMTFFDRECSPAQQRIVSRLFERSALVLALSDTWRDNVLRMAPTCRVEVLANAVAMPDLSRIRREPGRAPTVLCLGRLGKRKGSFDLLEAFARLPDRNARLILAGDGDIERVREHARRLGLADRVSCPGWLSRDQTADALAAATVFVLPSYAEGLPMALLEAMSYALPVITTPVGGIPGVIRHGENGLLVEPGDVAGLTNALAALLADPAERARLGAATRLTVEQRFSQDAAIDRLAAVYRRFGVRTAERGLTEQGQP